MLHPYCLIRFTCNYAAKHLGEAGGIEDPSEGPNIPWTRTPASLLCSEDEFRGKAGSVGTNGGSLQCRGVLLHFCLFFSPQSFIPAVVQSFLL